MNAPILSMIGMSAKEKIAMNDLLKDLRKQNKPYVVLDMKKLSANHYVIDFKTWNMSHDEGKVYYDKIFNKLKLQGYSVEKSIH